MAMVGNRLRELRKNRNLTLQQVADETSFAVSFLSLLERDKVSISVDNLERLARYYGVRMIHFFEGAEENAPQVTRAAQVETQFRGTGPGESKFLLLAHRRDARMEPLLVSIGPGHGDPQFRTHEGDALLYVLAGRVRLIPEQGEPMELGAGDAAYYPGFPGRRIENASQREPARILLTTAPPTTIRDDVADTERGILIQSEE